MRTAIVFEASREGYSMNQIDPITVGELRNILDQYNDDTLFVLSHDHGYTFGTIYEGDMSEYEQTEDGGDWDRA